MSPETMSDRSCGTTQGNLGKQISAALGNLTLEKVAEQGFANARANAVPISKGKNILSLADTPLMDGASALVIAAGPSLHRQDTGKIIKESNFEGVIIATDSVLCWCLRQGIIPHLVVTLDPHPERIVRWFGDPHLTNEALTRDDYFARQDMDPNFRADQIRFNREVIDLINAYGPHVRIAVASSASPAVSSRILESGMQAYWWNPMYDDDDMEDSLTRKIHATNRLPCLNAGGNVGTACWVIAHAVLGKKRVGLVGMDFGYYPETPYLQTQYYKEILELVGPHRLDEVYVRLLNPHVHSEFYTDPAYLWYRNSFLEMIQGGDCETHNCTGGGILFGPGIHWNDLKEFLSGSGPGIHWNS